MKEVGKFANKGSWLWQETHCRLRCTAIFQLCARTRYLPYVCIPSKTDLGTATGSKRPTCVTVVKRYEDYQEAYGKCLEEG